VTLPPRLRKPATLLAAIGLALLLVVLAFRWWNRYVEHGLARWAVGETVRRTGGAYRMVLSDPTFLPLAGSISFDSMVVTTDSVANSRRASPLPALEWRAHHCGVEGLDVLRVLLRRSFVARELGCSRVIAAIALVPRIPDARRGVGPTVASALGSARPLGLSAFRIAAVSIPRLDVRLTGLGKRGGKSVRSDHARFEASDLVFDPAPDARAGPALSAKDARLTVTGLAARLDPRGEVTVDGLEADLIHSTLRLTGARYEPSIPEPDWIRRHRFRRDRIRLELDSLRARGFAWRGFIATGEIGIRALELDRPRLDVLSDRRLPPGRPVRHRIPQQVAASHGPALRLDSVIVTRGSIVYRERRPGRDRPGQLSFDAVRATVLHLDLPSRGRPLTVAAGAQLMKEGRLTVQASVPLDAPDFRYRLSGRLGSMSAAEFNRMLSENEAYEVADGSIESITFEQATDAGHTVTTLTPRYYDLSVQPTGEGGGLFGSVKRSVKKFVANAFKVRSRNPGEDGKNLRIARTARRYDPADPWIRHLWISLRDGLMEGVKE
jgi:hypothetical protein